MDKLKQNPFWVVIGVAGVALIAGFALLVYPKWGERDTLRNKIKGLTTPLRGAVQDVHSEEDIHAWEDFDKDGKKGLQRVLKEHYGQIANLYLDANKKLELWLVQGEGGGPPPRRTFDTAFQTELRKLENSLKELPESFPKERRIKIGLVDEPGENQYNFGFNWELLGDDDWREVGKDEPEVLKELQKRFRIRERIANACHWKAAKEGKMEDCAIVRLKDVHFFRLLHSKIRNAKWDTLMAAASVIIYPADPTATNDPISGKPKAVSPMGRDRFTDYELPGKTPGDPNSKSLGKTITFGVTVDINFSDVPKFIENLLNKDLEPNILLNVIGVHVSVREQNKSLETASYQKPSPPNEERENQIKKEKEDQLLSGYKPKLVQLSVTCQVIDVNSEVVKPKP